MIRLNRKTQPGLVAPGARLRSPMAVHTYIGDDKKTGITSWDYGHLTLVASDFLAKNLLAPLIVDNNAKPNNILGP